VVGRASNNNMPIKSTEQAKKDRMAWYCLFTCSSLSWRNDAHNSSSPLIDTSFVVSIMTVVTVWERKKERKKGEEARMVTAAMCMMDFEQEVSPTLH
jgi:hypothetical protein